MKQEKRIVVRGGGDLATGTIHRLWSAGLRVLVLEAEHPAAIRRQVSLCEAVYEGETTVEGLQSDAERVDYYEELAGGTRQLLNIIEENLRKHELAIFPSGGLYAQGHVKMVPQGDTYTPKELMEMDWLGECVEGALPLYEDLDVKTRGLMEINGLGSLKGMPL